MKRIDEIIHNIRRAISKIAEEFDSTTSDLIDFVSVSDKAAYNSVIDSLYLLEDSQLAKRSFAETPLANEEFGMLYLLFYGALNSCYMQQQAILVISSKLDIKANIEDIKKSKVISYRNDFSSHSSNRGHGANEHSYILDRHAMREGKVKGYTSNHTGGDIFKDESIFELISNWDSLLERQLELVATKILKSKQST